MNDGFLVECLLSLEPLLTAFVNENGLSIFSFELGSLAEGSSFKVVAE